MDGRSDPDGDGLANGLEYVLGSDPARPDSLARVVLERTRGPEGQPEITIRHGVRSGVDERPRLWVSEDLVDWRLPLAGEIELVERAESGSLEVDVEEWRWLGEHGKTTYLRLGVLLPEPP
jgi:hypothetical protein